MQEPPDLASIFFHNARISLILPDGTAEFERLLHELWERGRARWPDIPLPADMFVRHLALRLPPSEGDPLEHVQQFLTELVAEDYYLACACAQEISAAIIAFERHYLTQLPMQLAHLRQSDAVVDDICQLVRTKLLVRTTDAQPKIAEYSGRGALLSWLRVTAVRTAVSLMRTVKEVANDNVAAAYEALPSPGADPELDLIKRNYHGEFRQAVADAFAELSDEERHLLRLYVVQRLSTAEIGLLFLVNQSTISRRLQSVRQRIYEETKRLLTDRLGLSSGEFKSLLRFVDSELDVSISQLFGQEEKSQRSTTHPHET